MSSEQQIPVSPVSSVQVQQQNELEPQFVCSECGEEFIEDPEVTLYECGECGDIWSKEDTGSHRCENCNKFAGVLTHSGCPECGQGELEEIDEPTCN